MARAPTRVDLGGGWTDVPPYCEREGGFVCNVAITRYVTARLSAAQPGPNHGGLGEAATLVRATLARRNVTDIGVEISSQVPVGAGLGGSSAASAALLGAIAEWKGENWQRSELAEEGRRIEVEELGIAGGRQDHYAATHGGALALTFGATTAVARIDLSRETRAAFAERAILVYTGKSRISGDTITAVLGAYEAGERRVVTALARMQALARQMAAALERDQLDDVGALLREHWTHQRSLHPTIPTERIDQIIENASRAGALGAKAMGASGGGCVLVLCRAGERDAVARSVAALGELLPFDVDIAGLTVKREQPA